MAIATGELRTMIRGFRKLAEDDRALLCLWFGVSQDATAEEACRVLASGAVRPL